MTTSSSKSSTTIDRLGVGVSKRYAEDQTKTDPSLIRDSHKVPALTTVTTTSPSFPSQVDELLELQQKSSWATFEAPPNFASHKKNLFSFLVIPALGSDEKQAILKDRIEALSKLTRQKEQEQKKEQEQRKDKEKEEGEEHEKKEEIRTLASCLSALGLLDKYLLYIRGKLEQYKRG